jgi:hypothetical protein
MLMLRNNDVMPGKCKAVGMCTNGSGIQKRITGLYTVTLSFLLVVPQATGHIKAYIYIMSIEREFSSNSFPELLLHFLFIYDLVNDTSRNLDNTAQNS